MTSFPAKVNIHMCLEGELLSYVERINAPIVNLGFEDVSFQKDSLQIPHATLLMGNVESFLQLDELLRKVQILTEGLPTFEYEVTAPYLVGTSNRFCFLNIKNPDQFYTLKKRLAKALDGILALDFHGGPDNPPHITFGYCNISQPDLPKESKEVFLGKSVAKCVGVSFAGIRGSCSENLLRVLLN